MSQNAQSARSTNIQCQCALLLICYARRQTPVGKRQLANASWHILCSQTPVGMSQNAQSARSTSIQCQCALLLICYASRQTSIGERQFANSSLANATWHGPKCSICKVNKHPMPVRTVVDLLCQKANASRQTPVGISFARKRHLACPKMLNLQGQQTSNASAHYC